MEIAVWVIAACEVIRLIQNAVQLAMYNSDKGARENAYAEFVNSLHDSDKEFVHRLLEEIERQEKCEQEERC